MLAANLINRLFQVIRTITIARWLGPEEMGVYAVAVLVLATLEVFSETGLRPALIQRPGDIGPYILPVRTLQAVRGLLIGVAVFFCAPLLASFFHSPKSLSVIRVLALLPIINGLEPLFIVLAQKELNFRPVVILQVVSAFVSLLVGVVAAYFRPDAWAMVWASLTGAIITTTGSHLLSQPRRLGFTFKWGPLRDIRTFGFYILLITIMSYVFLRGGDWMIGRLLDVRALALYQMTYMICNTITQEVGKVASKLAFPVFSHLQDDKDRLRNAYRQTFGFIAITTLPLAGLVVACAPDFYPLLLGEEWLGGLPLVPWMVVVSVCGVFAGPFGGLLNGLNKPHLWVTTLIVMIALLAVGLYPVTQWKGSLGVAILMSSIYVAIQFVRYSIVSKVLGMPFLKITQHVIMPVAACLVAVAGAQSFRNLLPIDNHICGLICSATSIVVIYLSVLFLGKQWMEPSFGELRERIGTLFRRDEIAAR